MLPRLLQFRVVLPVTNLLLWFIVLVAPTAVALARWSQQSKGQDPVTLTSKSAAICMPRSHLAGFALSTVGYRRAKVLIGMNVPGVLVQNVTSLAVHGTAPWCPPTVLPDSWSTFLAPIIGLPFWFLSGFGLDALFRGQRPRLFTLISGVVLFVIPAVLLVAFRVGMSAFERSEMTVPLWGFGVWAGAFAAFPTALLLRRRVPA